MEIICLGMPRIDCNIEEFNWRPIEVFNTKAHSTLEAWRQRPMMMVDKEAHGMKAFLGLGPRCNLF